MRNKFKFLILIVGFFIVSLFIKLGYLEVLALQINQSNTVVTQVGTPSGPKPSPENPLPTSIPVTNPTTAASCPVIGGHITTHSYEVDPKKGHCAPGSYEFSCLAACPTSGRRAKAIDVTTNSKNGQEVVLPTISDQVAEWKFIQPLCGGGGVYPNCYAKNGGTGALYTFEGTVLGSSDRWYLQFVHMLAGTPLLVSAFYPSGTKVGYTDISHVHTTIGKNIQNPLGSGNATTDCDPGWLASDFMCQ